MPKATDRNCRREAASINRPPKPGKRESTAMIHAMMRQYRPWRFLVLLVTLALLLVIQPMVGGFTVRGPVFDALYSLVLVAAILSLRERRRPWMAALLLGVPALLGRWLAYLLSSAGEDFLTLTDHFVEILFLGFVAVMILRLILTQSKISADSIFGAICVYLLLGMAWGTFYAAIEVLRPGSFVASGDLADALKSAETRGPVLIYYSFVTLTTVGYGDITPIAPSARTLSWLEAMMGQFYIAILVASLVGIRLSQRPATLSSDNDGPERSP
jgi:voltage-gated potassium channel